MSIRSEIGPYAIVPRWVLRSELSPMAKLLYAAMADRADREDGSLTFGRRVLAEDIGIKTVTHVSRLLKELEQFGAIVVQRADRPVKGSGDSYQPNTYWVVQADPKVREVVRSKSLPSAPQSTRPSAPESTTPSAPERTQKKNHSQEPTPPASTSGGPPPSVPDEPSTPDGAERGDEKPKRRKKRSGVPPMVEQPPDALQLAQHVVDCFNALAEAEDRPERQQLSDAAVNEARLLLTEGAKHSTESISVPPVPLETATRLVDFVYKHPEYAPPRPGHRPFRWADVIQSGAGLRRNWIEATKWANAMIEAKKAHRPNEPQLPAQTREVFRAEDQEPRMSAEERKAVIARQRAARAAKGGPNLRAVS